MLDIIGDSKKVANLAYSFQASEEIIEVWKEYV